MGGVCFKKGVIKIFCDSLFIHFVFLLLFKSAATAAGTAIAGATALFGSCNGFGIVACCGHLDDMKNIFKHFVEFVLGIPY